MLVTVLRVGQHQGVTFAEVAHVLDDGTTAPLHYSVPLAAPVELGTQLEVTVSEVAPPEEPTTEETPTPEGETEAPSDTDGVITGDTSVQQGKLPPDFPGYAALAAAGIHTYAQLRKAGDVTSIPGIGPATEEKITEALEG